MLAGAKLKIILWVLLSHNVIACMYMVLVGRALDKSLSGLSCQSLAVGFVKPGVASHVAFFM